MITKTQQGLQLDIFAFKTEKGTFRISATHSDGTDEWREVGTNNFHRWSRQKVYDWWKSGKIEAITEANSIERALSIVI